MSEYRGNITAAGARQRRTAGIVGLVLAVGLWAILILVGAPRAARLVLVIPFGIAAIGFLQARAKTCVALAAVGKREVEGGGTCELEAGERSAVSARVAKVTAGAVAAAVIATAIAYFA